VYISVAQTHDNFAFHLFIVACLILYNVLLHFIQDVCGTHCGGGYVGVKGYLVIVTKKKLSAPVSAAVCTSGSSILFLHCT
jgi:hypothetical protein